MSVEPQRILVVEDDPQIARLVVRGLRDHGYQVELRTNGEAIEETLRDYPTDCVVLDVMLPGDDGFTVLERVRRRSDVPVIVLTARTQLDDRLKAFELGAQDFVAKPFFIEELLARIQARVGGRENPNVLFGEVSVDLSARRVMRDGHEVPLTPSEFGILEYLVRRPGRAVSRRTLAERTAGPGEEAGERAVDVHVSRLRRKLGDSAAQHLATVRGLGYRFDAQVNA